MSRDINKLFGPFQTGIRILIKRANDAGIPAFVTDTTRTEAQQRRLVDAKLSWTMDSLHLTGEAADIAFTVNGKLSYDHNLYFKLYEIAKDIPFVIWPYNDLEWYWDFPHFQYDKTKEGVILENMDLRRINDALGLGEDASLNDVLERIKANSKEMASVYDKLKDYKEIKRRLEEETKMKIKCETELNDERDKPKLSDDVRRKLTISLLDAKNKIASVIDKLL